MYTKFRYKYQKERDYLLEPGACYNNIHFEMLCVRKYGLVSSGLEKNLVVESLEDYNISVSKKIS
jgi:hypothetical protein